MNTSTHIKNASNSLELLSNSMTEANKSLNDAMLELETLAVYIDKNASFDSLSRQNSVSSRFEDIRTLLVNARKATI